LNNNSQILGYWEKQVSSNKLVVDENIKKKVETSMKFLKFGYPVRNDDDLTEIFELCIFYDDLMNNPEVITKKFIKNSNNFNISISLTDRCGYNCHHCSTDSSLIRDKNSISFKILNKAFIEMAPHTRILYISCEGDPFFYESSLEIEKNTVEKKNIVDVIKLLMYYKFKNISIQSLAPPSNKFHLLEELLNIIDQEKDEGFLLLPQISFNLYPLRAGLEVRNKFDENGHEFKELYIPLIKKNEVKNYYLRLINEPIEKIFSNVNDIDNVTLEELKKLKNISSKLVQYLDDVKKTILAYASRNHLIHFEIRGEDINEFTTLETIDFILNKLLERLAMEHPEVNFPICNECNKIHYEINFAQIVPIGRAVNLISDGVNKEKIYFEKHVKMNPHNYLCDNWTSWGSMVIDTQGYPQLCYSNLALTPQARTTEGPNIYHDGFESIIEFYDRVWKDRINFLKENMIDLVKERPNSHYCPLKLFKKTLYNLI